MWKRQIRRREDIAHAVRRLGIGANPTIVEQYDDRNDAIAACLEYRDTSSLVPVVDPPLTWDDVTGLWGDQTLFQWWVERLSSGENLIEERMMWFWHDHFSTSDAKVEHAYAIREQARTIRRHATGNFADLLLAIATDPAMLRYLDGNSSDKYSPNENFGREVMELHTLGVGNYTQDDVVAAARCFTGMRINIPEWETNRFVDGLRPWTYFVDEDQRDTGTKTLLGITGDLTASDAITILLERPETGRTIASKLYRDIVGLEPDLTTVETLGAAFSKDYEIKGLIEAIVNHPAMFSPDAIRAKIRTPLEKLASLHQGWPHDGWDYEWADWMLQEIGYRPYYPPNPAGYPSGLELASPYKLAASFGLLYFANEGHGELDLSDDMIFQRFGIYDPSPTTRRVVASASTPYQAIGLVFGSPEFATT